MLSEPLLNLGRIHWYFLHADKLMMEKRFEAHPPGKIHKVVSTEFGDEVGNDEINWWVFKRESDLPLFHQKTQIALASAQILKDEAEKISKPFYSSLEDLNRTYEGFGSRCEKDINV